MPRWVDEAFAEYAQRLPPDVSLNLIEIPLIKRGKNPDIVRIKEQEAVLLQKAIAKDRFVVALDEQGEAWSTQQLAQKLKVWRDHQTHLSLLVGGPDGLAPNCLKLAKIHWSLSPLTLPHPLVRVMIAEQLYRAVSILQGHPYHRD